MDTSSANGLVQRVTVPSAALLFVGLALVLVATLLSDPEAAWLFWEVPRYLGGFLILVGLLLLQATWLEALASRGPASRGSSRRD